MRADFCSRSPGTFFLLLLVLALCLPSRGVHAQAGSIVGLVVDAENGEALIGANVVIDGTTVGSQTDLDGRFEIRRLEPGSYDVRISYLGFQPTLVQGVAVEAGEATRIEVALTPEAMGLGEVIVQAEAARNSEVGLLKQRQKASGVSDAISAEFIGRAGAGNAADAMSKVTGASVIDGKFVNVRGLQGRYVNAQLNGTSLPSADPDGNSVALDLFPSNLIDNIITTKTFTPDRAGNFTGGSIDISTKALPDEPFLNLSISSSFNSEVGLGGSLLRPSQGLSEIPAVARDGNVPNNLAEVFNDDEGAQQLDAISRAFSTSIAPVEKAILGNRSAEVSVGNQFYVLGDRALGVIGSLSYDRSYSGYSNGTTARFRQVGMTSETLTPTADFITQRGVEETLLGGLLGVAFQLAPNHQLSARALYNASSTEEARFESGQLPRDLSGDQVFQTRALSTTKRSVRSGEFKGTHQFGDGRGVRLVWSTSLSETSRDEPDHRFFANQYATRQAGADTTFGISRSIYLAPTRYFRNLSEQDASGSFSVEVPIGALRFKSGGQVNLRSRTFRERRFEHLDDQASYAGSPNAYINGQAGHIGKDAQGRNRFGTYVLDRTQPSNNYDGEQDVWAGFLMAEAPVPGLSNLQFIGGLRVEHTDMSIATVGGNRSGQFEETDLLPSANLIWSLQGDMNLRAAYGRTIARPSFREFAPLTSFSFIGDYIEIGNPDLTRTRVHNLDLRWEWFMRGSELLSVSTFYKAFEDPIERTIDTRAAGSDVVIEYVNKSGARVYGAEFEARKRLDGLAGWLEHVSVGANLTLIQSSVERSEDELEAVRAFDDNPSLTRPLQGQSPYLVNLNAAYENPGSGTSINVFFNRFGSRLDTVTRNGLDLFEQGRSTLDVTASQRLLGALTLKASGKNLLNAEHVILQSFRDTPFINDRNPLGRTVSVGFSYEL